MKKIVKKKRLVIGNKRAIKKTQDLSLNVRVLENQISNLTAQVTQLAQIVHKQEIERQTEKFQRPPVENIRVVNQKVDHTISEEPIYAKEKTEVLDFDKILKWTTSQVNNHLNSLSGPDLQDIVQSAITGQPIPGEVKHHPAGTQGKMADWLNSNISTVNTQENIWDAIDQAQVIAQKRNEARAIEAKEFTKDFIAAAKDSKALQEAYKLANVDTIET